MVRPLTPPPSLIGLALSGGIFLRLPLPLVMKTSSRRINTFNLYRFAKTNKGCQMEMKISVLCRVFS